MSNKEKVALPHFPEKPWGGLGWGVGVASEKQGDCQVLSRICSVHLLAKQLHLVLEKAGVEKRG